MGGGGSKQSTSKVVSVPGWAQPTVASYGSSAYALWQAATYQPYGGTIVAIQDSNETDGIDGLAVRGRQGDQVISKAISFLQDVFAGTYLTGIATDYTDMLALVTTKASSDFTTIEALVGKKPYFMGDSDSTFLARSMVANLDDTYNARLSSLLAHDNYQRERVNQDYGLAYGVEMGKHAAIDAETLRKAGLYQREYLQGTYEISHRMFIEEQELAVANLEIFGNCIRALTGSSQTTTQQMAQNKMMSAVGMAVAGGITGWMIGGPPGAVVGFLVGGVVGYFAA